jgi:hypothetical protein
VVKRRVAAPVSPPVRGRDPKLQLYIIFTSPEATESAMAAAELLAADLGASMALLFTRIVPYPLAMDNPPVPQDFTEQRLVELASTRRVETSVNVFMCRDRVGAIRNALAPDSLVVIGASSRWWWNRDRGLARLLRRDGHHVVVVDRYWNKRGQSQ